MLRFLQISALFIIISHVALGQKQVNSPYSRIGPGILETQGTFKSFGMGGTGIAMRDPQNLYYQNPASYSSIDTNSFVFDFAIDYRIVGLELGDEKYDSDDMNLHHIIMGFPISKKLGFATGVTAYSTGYYNINYAIEPGDPGYDPIIGETEESHKGAGGISKFFVGFGYNVFKGLSVGTNMSFFFGEVIRENKLFFLDDTRYFNNLNKQTFNTKGFAFDIGAHYNFEFGNDYFSTLGINYTNKSNFDMETETLLARTSYFTGTPISVDTLQYNALGSLSVTMPPSIAFGFTVGKKDKFTFTADYTMTNWEKAVFIGYEEFFTKSNSLNMGVSIIPNKYANYNALNRVEYRLGGRISDTYLMINNEQIKEFGITFGAGIPLNRSLSNVNVFFEYGKRGGSFEAGLHKETFYSMGLSFNFYDNWFMKRKYE